LVRKKKGTQMLAVISKNKKIDQLKRILLEGMLMENL
jgi:hypothetical protein